MAATAQKQWTLSEHESSTTLEAWKANLIHTLATEEAFSPFLEPNATWKKKTKKTPLRGFTGPNASAKTTILELMLLRISGFAPVLSRQTVVKNSTSLGSIWKALQLYYGVENCCDSTISPSQLSALHQPSYRSCSEPFQTVPPTLETLQAGINTREHSENIPQEVQHSSLAPVDDLATPCGSPKVHNTMNTSANASLHCQPDEGSIETAYGPPDEIQSTSTEMSSPMLLADPCTQRDHLEQFPGDHVSRADYCRLPSSPVFSDDSSKLDLYCQPVKSPQQQESFPKHVLEQFNGDCRPSEVPQQRISSPVVPSLSCESQIYFTDACSMNRCDNTSSDSDIGSNELLNSMNTNYHIEFQRKVLMNHENKVEQEPKHTIDSAGSHATKCIPDDILRPTTKESGGTSNEDELEHRLSKSHVNMVSWKLGPTMDSAKSYATEPDTDMPSKDMQIKLLKEELELLKEDHVYLQKNKTTAIEEMKEELRTANEERIQSEKRYVAIIDNMKQEWKIMEQETKLICRLKNTEILKLKEEISSLQHTKLVTMKTDDTIHRIPNVEPVKEKRRVSQARQLSDMQKPNDEWKGYKNENQGTDQQVQNKNRLHVTQKYQDHSYDKLEETESLSTLYYTREFTRNETAEMDEVNRPSRKPDHSRVRTKKCYRCGDDKHLIRDCTFGLKSWTRYSRMQPCYICGKTGHKQTNCWFRNKKPGEKPCFRCGSNEHIVKNCSLPRQTNASLATEENHSCFAQGDREHDENDWYTTNEERIRTLVMDAIHESLQRYGISLPEVPP